MNQINTVFVHVSSLRASVRWYSELLGFEYDLDLVTDPVYNISINQLTGLTLDAGSEDIKKHTRTSDYPLLNFHTEDIDRTFSYLEEMSYTIVSNIIRFDDFSFFIIEDLDKNIFMICIG